MGEQPQTEEAEAAVEVAVEAVVEIGEARPRVAVLCHRHWRLRCCCQCCQ